MQICSLNAKKIDNVDVKLIIASRLHVSFISCKLVLTDKIVLDVILSMRVAKQQNSFFINQSHELQYTKNKNKILDLKLFHDKPFPQPGEGINSKAQRGAARREEGRVDAARLPTQDGD